MFFILSHIRLLLYPTLPSPTGNLKPTLLFGLEIFFEKTERKQIQNNFIGLNLGSKEGGSPFKYYKSELREKFYLFRETYSMIFVEFGHFKFNEND